MDITAIKSNILTINAYALFNTPISLSKSNLSVENSSLHNSDLQYK